MNYKLGMRFLPAVEKTGQWFSCFFKVDDVKNDEHLSRHCGLDPQSLGITTIKEMLKQVQHDERSCFRFSSKLMMN